MMKHRFRWQSMVATSFKLLVLASIPVTAIAQESEVVEVVIQEETNQIQEETNQEESNAKPAAKNLKEYQFTVQSAADCTDVKSQDSTGTCWSFATTSFLEAELICLGRPSLNLSEMFIVKNIYREKASNFVLRQGKANFGEGALAHDYINAVSRYGVVPEEVFSGKLDPAEGHNHAEMVAMLQSVLDAVVKMKSPSNKWKAAYDFILDAYLGTSPEEFEVDGQVYDAKAYAKSFGFDASDYVNITSYTHHPFYESFVLEIPDNFSNGSYLNLPIDELMEVIDNAVAKGYSVAWDGDVSEPTFSAGAGLAVMPTPENRRTALRKPGEEQEISQEMRQETFESFGTTDDHLMHLVGIATDQTGTKYYMIKNSWGEMGPYKGYIHMSEAYARLKTVSILVHKDALPARLRLK